MARLTIRNLDHEVKHYLRMRAALHGSSMEAEVRVILSEAVQRQSLEQLAIAKAYGNASPPDAGPEAA